MHPDPSPLSAAQELSILKGYEKILKDRINQLRETVQTEMEASDSVTLKPKISGEQVSTISYSEGKRTVLVTDERAFLAYVRQHHPDEVVPMVSVAFRGKVMAEVAKFGTFADPDGVRQDWIEIRQGEPYITVTPTEVGEQIAAGSRPVGLTAARTAVVLDQVDAAIAQYPEGFTRRERPARLIEDE